MSPLWQLLKDLFTIRQSFETTLENILCYWANLYCYKWSNIEKYGHTGSGYYGDTYVHRPSAQPTVFPWVHLLRNIFYDVGNVHKVKLVDLLLPMCLMDIVVPCAIPGLFFLFSSFKQLKVNILSVIKLLMDGFEPGSSMLEATALSTVSQPLHFLKGPNPTSFILVLFTLQFKWQI